MSENKGQTLYISEQIDTNKDNILNQTEIDNLVSLKEETKKLREDFVNNLKKDGKEINEALQKKIPVSKEKVEHLLKMISSLDDAEKSYTGIRGLFTENAKEKEKVLKELMDGLKETKESLLKSLETIKATENAHLEKVIKEENKDKIKNLQVGNKIEIDQKAETTFTDKNGETTTDRYNVSLGRNNKGYYLEINDYGENTFINIENYNEDTINKALNLYKEGKDSDGKTIGSVFKEFFDLKNGGLVRVNAKKEKKEEEEKIKIATLISELDGLIKKFLPLNNEKAKEDLQAIVTQMNLIKINANGLSNKGDLDKQVENYKERLISNITTIYGSDPNKELQNELLKMINGKPKEKGYFKFDILTDRERLDLLADLDNNNKVDNEIKDFVSEKDLRKSLSHASKNAGGIDKVYERVTGANPDWSDPKETTKKFHRSLRVSIEIIRQLTLGGNAGLNALLLGKTKEFVKQVKEKVKTSGGKPLEIKFDEKNSELSPTTHNILGAFLTAGVAIISQGTITAGHEKHSINADGVMKDIKKDTEGSIGKKIEDVLFWIKEAFMGRKLSLTLGRERVADFTKNVSSHAKEVMNLKPDTNPETINNPELKEAFSVAIKTLKDTGVKPEEHFDKIQKALIQSYIIGEGFKNEGSNWSGSIGILMLLGIHRDGIKTNIKTTKSSEYSKIDSELTKTAISEDEYKNAGIKIENKGGQYIYTIPKEIELASDKEKVTVMSSLPLDDTKTNYVLNSPKPQNISLSYSGGRYILSSTESTTNSSSVEVTKKQAQTEVKNLRSGEKLAQKDVPDLLYYIGHYPDPKFKELIITLSKQNFTEAETILNSMSEKGKWRSIAKKILSDKDNMPIWLSYMYGNKESRKKQEFTQEYANKEIRTSLVINAEMKLAEKNGIAKETTKESEFQFEKGAIIKGVQASSLFAGQEMTILDFATPRVDGKKGYLHRLDTFDGSVSISPKKVELTDTDYKKQVIEAIFKNVIQSKGINYQLEKLNNFLKENKPGASVTIDQYKNYLVSGKVEDLGVSDLKVQEGKETKIFEGRAMIGGNVCLNRLYGIVYPLFEIPGKTIQKPETVVTCDLTTPLAETGVTTQQDALGINPIGVIGNLAKSSSNGGGNNLDDGTFSGATRVTPTDPSTSPVSDVGAGIGVKGF